MSRTKDCEGSLRAFGAVLAVVGKTFADGDFETAANILARMPFVIQAVDYSLLSTEDPNVSARSLAESLRKTVSLLESERRREKI